MKFYRNKRPLVWPLLTIVALQGFAEEAPSDGVTSLAPVIINGTLPINPSLTPLSELSRNQGSSADGGDFLRMFNGVSAGRFGGRGLDPVIRGQSQTRINVELDGANIHGGCPNRMDPPSSWAALETYEEVYVEKGLQTLSRGSGAGGGSVIFKRNSHKLAQEKGFHGRVSGLAASNGTQSDILADVIGAGESMYLRVLAENKKNENYEDGNGDEVRSSFDHLQAGFIAGTELAKDHLLELSYEYHLFEDALYPGAGMDSPEEKGNVYRLKYEGELGLRAAETLEAQATLSDISHLMNNFSLRPAGMAKMETETESLTKGLRVISTFRKGRNLINYGLNVEIRERDAKLYNRGSGAFVSNMWPDTTQTKSGVFVEMESFLTSQYTLKYGIRIDALKSAADQANSAATSADKAYSTYYGVDADDHEETAFGGLIRNEYAMSEDTTFFLGLSRSIRAADETERYINKWVKMANQRWIGNPQIDNEVHHQIDLGFSSEFLADSHWGLSAYYNDIGDYILREGARGQNGVLQSDNADVYRNVDARIYGLEAECLYHFRRHWSMMTSLSWLRADNTTDSRPLPQIPSLNGRVDLEYGHDNWGAGLRTHFAAQQTRIDTLSKQEVGESAGYMVFDLYAHYRFTENYGLRFGVDNVLDHLYADHLSRSDNFSTESIRVNEPGMSAWLKLHISF
ncbi:MAG: TonB-dependent receptor [Planctomycetes bacterium]|nr:TonB-dependent receptor [Planctomycetota bacterium]